MGVRSRIAGFPAANLGIIIVMIAFWSALGSFIVPAARYTDFLNLYIGGKLSNEGRHSELHDPALQLAEERLYVPDKAQLVPFVRPHFYAWMLGPLAQIPFEPAFWIWIGLHCTLLAGCWYWSWREFGPDAPVIGSLFLPTALGIAHGQDCVFMLCIVIASYVLATRERPLLSGLVLSLGLMKFHLLLLIPVAMLLQRRWRMLSGFSIGAAGGVAFGLALGGIQGSRGYIRMLLDREGIKGLYPSPELMTNIHGLARNLAGDDLWLRLLLVAVVLALFLLATWRAPYRRWLSASIAATLLAVPHVHGYDTAILLLPVWLGMFVSDFAPTKLAAATLVMPPVFLMTIGGVPWAAAPSLAMLAFLVALAVENVREIGVTSAGGIAGATSSVQPAIELIEHSQAR